MRKIELSFGQMYRYIKMNSFFDYILLRSKLNKCKQADVEIYKRRADFEQIMREAKIKSWKEPVSIFGVLAYRYENREQVEQTLKEKLDAVSELERDFFDELMIREMYPNVAEWADAMDIPINDALPDFRR